MTTQHAYETYLDSEWLSFARHPDRGDALLAATGDIDVRRVLDVGCGAGQELAPFARRGAFGVGVDIDSASGPHGRRLYERYHPEARVAFLTGAAESLPFRDASFDATICRVALPYTDNAHALAEMSRVLRPGGNLLLKIQHHWFYIGEAIGGLRKGRILPAVHALRVMAAGAWYQLAGRQPRSRWPSREAAQSESLLRRELARVGMVITGRMPDWNRETPSFVIKKVQ